MQISDERINFAHKSIYDPTQVRNEVYIQKEAKKQVNYGANILILTLAILKRRNKKYYVGGKHR
jgi:uncharacterized SAM-dependent methyltransferase